MRRLFGNSTATAAYLPMMIFIIFPSSKIMFCLGYIFRFFLAADFANMLMSAFRSAGRFRQGFPFSPCVSVLPNRIQRYVGTHRIGLEVPHSLSACVQSKPDKPRALFGRRRNLSDDLSVPDSYIRNIIAALRIECNGKTCGFVTCRKYANYKHKTTQNRQ